MALNNRILGSDARPDLTHQLELSHINRLNARTEMLGNVSRFETVQLVESVQCRWHLALFIYHHTVNCIPLPQPAASLGITLRHPNSFVHSSVTADRPPCSPGDFPWTAVFGLSEISRKTLDRIACVTLLNPLWAFIMLHLQCQKLFWDIFRIAGGWNDRAVFCIWVIDFTGGVRVHGVVLIANCGPVFAHETHREGAGEVDEESYD